MCDNVIIHNPGGSYYICRTQLELKELMPNGIWFIPPMSYADWSRCGEGFYLYTGSIEKYRYIPAVESPADIELIHKHGFSKHTCLCPVDLEKTAEMNGYISSKLDRDGEFDPFDTHFYRK